MMKFFGLIAALFFTAAVVAQGVNKTDAQGRKQGVWQKNYPKSTAFEYKGQFKDDKPVGTFTYYYPSTKVKAVIKHDEKTGRSAALMYHESGVLFARGIYKNQLKDSVWDYFGPSGRLSKKETYLKDQLHGKTTVYYVSENPEDKRELPAKVTNYVNGVLDGEVIEYFESGTIKSKGTYVKGAKEGLFTINHPDGKKMIIERYKKGERHGWCATYDNTGKETGKKYFYYGRELEGKELEEKLRQMKALGISPNG
jgi:antitoxin component YwqK of YwqJK toxin-antitoxin module